ncbi:MULTISPECIES: YceI family protein [Sphingomonas]|uniref:YceI family protein n=1 Tax=Sphingomonas TaxID=13687 RepID=UPI000830DBFB|nr:MULTISPECIES: YceI family protein [Sphingomonas]MBY0301792.1 YceI family protein [Sphingomonas ginsenosidimutans]
MRYVIAAALMAAAVPAVAQMAAAPAMPGAPTTRVAAGTYQVDPAHTQVTWEVNHMGFSMLQGQFGASGGSITIDPAKPAQTKVDVTFAIADLSVTSSQFATHLKSKDFFDVAANPNARFVSTAVTPRGANRATMTGNLTIKGITKPVTLDVTFVGAGANPMTKKLNFGFRAMGTIKRSDFGLGMAVPIVSDEVKLTVNAAFTA